ncbi:lysophospholipase catalytic domain-containing protein [Suillus clintonianus]|uniref:lysophospholipase catalytic domain-containing protein n=1 Tax=Suillus clintonianus TaxID=1904413 RepID=UPI001B87089B|nr:lysophospholipase catalytic domain-containing protein [Suillus clintonianus]KAG2123253.1 lysophospholipase catalytic domain-containing protein [Suillus clintonianus]
MLPTLLVASSLPLFAVAQSAASLAYTPVYDACPSGFTLVRQAGSNAAGNQTLNSQETAYINGRKSNVLPNAWKTYLSNLEATNTSLPSYVSGILSGNSSGYPNLGIACSGGGWRASMFGAGVMNALDGRNTASVALGTGGLLQAAQYLTGLSGGANLVGSLAQANFPTMDVLAFGTNSTDPTNAWGGWLAQINQEAPYVNTTQNNEYIQLLVEEVRGKFEAGFAVSYVDVVARDNGRHFVNGTDVNNFFDESLVHGAGYTWSGVANISTFLSYEQPFPILVATLLSPNGNMSTVIPNSSFIIPTSNPIMELNVYEMGSYDPTLAAFTPMKYLGTMNESICATNYDQTGLIAGASGDWNTYYNTSESTLVSSSMYPIIEILNNTLPQTNIVLDGTLFPNSFHGAATEGTFIDAGETIIAMSDGGSDGEAVPIQPLLVKARGVDTIFAIDSNQDWANAYWSAGGSLINTQTRINALFPTEYSFPPVPTNVSEFIAQNLSTRPTFFGCDSSTEAPLIIYLANGGPPRDGQTPLTNVSPNNVTTEQMQAFLNQTFTIATQGNPANASSAIDLEWPACLACGVVDRARNRSGVERSGVCSGCFERYCWNGSTYGLEVTSDADTLYVNSGLRVAGVVATSLIFLAFT